jgi:DNA polymerase-3 subunit delta
VKPGEEGARTLAFLADRVEGNLLAAQQEIAKLALLHPAGELGFDQVEAAVLDVARYDVAKLAEAVWAGQVARALRMLEGLEAEGESAVFVHWTLAEDLRALARARSALDDGQPLPMALKSARVWGAKERLFERVLPRLSAADAARLLGVASVCDGLIKGLKHPDWPLDPWQALQRLILMTMEMVAPAPRGARPGRLVLAG